MKEVQIIGTYREYSWGTQIQRSKRPTTGTPLTTKLMSREDADRVFNRKEFGRFSLGIERLIEGGR